MLNLSAYINYLLPGIDKVSINIKIKKPAYIPSNLFSIFFALALPEFSSKDFS